MMSIARVMCPKCQGKNLRSNCSRQPGQDMPCPHCQGKGYQELRNLVCAAAPNVPVVIFSNDISGFLSTGSAASSVRTDTAE